ncbi:MAG: acyl-phosphate glycerol 3-phosphate acyltransferase [Candidatus Parabeggiatoa sp. nov. 3]|nr:MAG: acyl-phosphate glycerol 3-phosphate acyltransferase [Gammaproteobacteria bacterium]RKZ62889.1 MAG: acyl-phosphate glycerol 3-phosphate acyltransferase [Gammaproteobacteria bacterium]RKZ83803.1 MAG: acyl-phosphate glycerol 3-phosphate acyltransferase [Gammaproteobacteria bacterium]HEW98185.1 glycerol-3-phosphate 1-O-acyltransferase [Beggiatoa sp.]
MLINSLLIISAYLLGSVSGALLVCKIMGLSDPRTQGSGNPGATNVLRHGGKKAAIITLCLDVLKGVIAVGVAKWLTTEAGILAAVTLAVFLGHLYPIFFQFRGGKGVATAFGALLVLARPVGLAALATWLMIALLFRYSSLSAIVTAILIPAYLFWLTGVQEYILMSFIMSALLIWRHRSNIRQLWTGQEDKIG